MQHGQRPHDGNGDSTVNVSEHFIKLLRGPVLNSPRARLARHLLVLLIPANLAVEGW